MIGLFSRGNDWGIGGGGEETQSQKKKKGNAHTAAAAFMEHSRLGS